MKARCVALGLLGFAFWFAACDDSDGARPLTAPGSGVRISGGEDARRDAGESVTSDARPMGPLDAASGADACAAGETRCAQSGERVEICLGDGRWVDKEPCASTCEDGACAGGCVVGERRCGRRQTPARCDRTGSWVTEARCAAACVGQGECVGECVPGTRRCAGRDGLTPEACDEGGRWNSEARCAFVCARGQCEGACAPGSRRCGDDGAPQLCSSAGVFESEPRCRFICSGDGRCAGECRPGEGACDGNTPRTCDDDGQWRAGNACVDRACVDGECVGECAPSTRECRGNELATCDDSGRFRSERCAARCVRDHCAECAEDSDCPGDAICQDEHCVRIRCFGEPINGQGTGQACCDPRCGAAGFELTAAEDPNRVPPEMKGCGQANCGDSRAGPSGCCTATIRVEGRSCKETRSAPCWLSQ